MNTYIKEIDNWNNYINHEKNNSYFVLKKDVDELNLVYYKIVYKIPTNKEKCIETLTDPEIRQLLSNNKMRCKVLHNVSDNTKNKIWYEKINFSEELYSIEKINVNYDNYLIYSFSETNNAIQDNGNILNKRENIFTGIKIFNDDESNDPRNNSVVVVLLTFGLFEMISDNIVDGTISYLDNLKNLFIKK